MLHINTTVLINRPLKEVVDYFLDIEKAPYWVVDLKGVKFITQGPIKLGSRFTWTHLFFGKEHEQTVEVTQYEPYVLITFKVISPYTAVYYYTFEPVMTGTNVTLFFEGEPAPDAAIQPPVFNALFTRRLQSGLENLKDILEVEALVPA